MTIQDPLVSTAQTTMRLLEFTEYGGPEVLDKATIDIAEPAAREVRVRMKALALNRSNALFRSGTYVFEASFPSRIGTEGVGEVDAIGADVTEYVIGQRVNLLPPDNESTHGYAADFNNVPQEKLLPAPDGLADRQAATAWVPFLTIYHHFVEKGLAVPGRWIVLPAASSSVSLAANSLAHHLGAKTIGITRTVAKKAALEAAGYDAVIISEEEDISARLLEITGEGADFVFDPVGGPQLEKIIGGVKRGAEINVYGVLDSAETPLPVFALMNSGATIGCYMVYELLVDPTRLRAAIDYYLPLFKSGQIAPVADDQLFTFDQSVEAFQHMESNTQLGKVIVSF